LEIEKMTFPVLIVICTVLEIIQSIIEIESIDKKADFGHKKNPTPRRRSGPPTVTSRWDDLEL